VKVLGINALYHDPAAALVVDGKVVAAAEEERFSRRKHGKRPLPWSAWELPELSAAWVLAEAGLSPSDLDAVAYSFDPGLCPPDQLAMADDPWDNLRVDYARRAPSFLATALPGLEEERVQFVRHHVAHAASAALAGPYPDSACLVLDGRGERTSHLAGEYADGRLTTLAGQALPSSLGLLYEDLTAHLGFHRSSDEYKVMALASYGEPRHLADFSELVRTVDGGGFVTQKVDWSAYAPPGDGEHLTDAHADLAATVQRRLEQVLLELARWLHDRTGARHLTMAGGTALNCVANAVIRRDGPYDDLWVQPAAGDAGTALGAALAVAVPGDRVDEPMGSAALGRGFTDGEIEAELRRARVPFERPDDLAAEVASDLAEHRVVAWFQGRSEFGPRALGQRSLLAHPGRRETLELLNNIKGREQFRPVAPLVRLERAAEIFEGQIPSPYMLFVHQVRPAWRERIAAVVHVDGTARVQTVDAAEQPLLATLLAEFDRRTGVPVLVNTSLNTVGRPMVDTPHDALELFGSAPIDLLAIGPFLLRRPDPAVVSAVVSRGGQS
jgi:carbamoyltransferase